MLTDILAAGTMVSAALVMSILPSQAGEGLPTENLTLGGLAPIQLQNVGAGGAGQPLNGDFFLRLTQVNKTTLSAVNAGISVRNRVFGPGTGMISTGSIQDIHLENVQGITSIIVNTGINSNIQQSVSVNYVIRPPAE